MKWTPLVSHNVAAVCRSRTREELTLGVDSDRHRPDTLLAYLVGFRTSCDIESGKQLWVLTWWFRTGFACRSHPQPQVKVHVEIVLHSDALADVATPLLPDAACRDHWELGAG